MPATLALIESGTAKKGDVLGIARIAGIQAAKKTSDLIPLCHPLALTRVAVDFALADGGAPQVACTATVETVGPTGVEMEALTAVQVALLTIYDMCKAVDRGHAHHRRARAGEARRQVGAATWRAEPVRPGRRPAAGRRSSGVLVRKGRAEARGRCNGLVVLAPSSTALSISFSITDGSGE